MVSDIDAPQRGKLEFKLVVMHYKKRCKPPKNQLMPSPPQ